MNRHDGPEDQQRRRPLHASARCPTYRRRSAAISAASCRPPAATSRSSTTPARGRASAQHRDERPAASAVERPPVFGRFTRALGRQHARRRRHQLHADARLVRVAREQAPRRALHADRPDVARIQGHRDDPTVFTPPWTIQMELTKQSDEKNRIYYEPRCHEGNYGLPALMLAAPARTEQQVTRLARVRDPTPAGHDRLRRH